MKKLLLLSAMFAIYNPGKAQKQNLFVNLEENKAFIEIAIDSNGVIQLKDSLNGVMTITFPDSNFLNWSIKFNEKKSFYVGFTCEGDSCLKLHSNDLKNSRLKLYFSRGELVAIEDRRIEPRAVTGSKPFVKIVKEKTEKAKDMYDALKVSDPAKNPQLSLLPEKTKMDSYKFYCGNFECQDCRRDEKGVMISSPIDEKKYNLFTKVFLKRNTFHDNISGKDVTAKYWIVYDNREGKKMIPYYFKIHNSWDSTRFLKTKTRLYPQAYRQAVITILGPSDTAYYTVDDKTVDRFLEMEKDASSTLDKIAPSSSTPTEIESSGEAKTSSKLSGVSGVFITGFQEQQKLLSEAKEMLANNFVKDPATQDKMNKLVVTCDEILKQLIRTEERKNSLIDELGKEKMKNAKDRKLLEDSIATLNKKLTDEIAEVKRLTDLNGSRDQVKDLGEKMMSLEKALEKFNYVYDDISYVEGQYKRDLLCLMLNIKDILGIPVSSSSKDVAQYLISLVLSTDKSKNYYTSYTYLIKQLESQYKEALAKKAKWSLFSVSKKIPNNDEFITSFTTPKGAKPFFSDSFNISGGLKIDFSTGLYVSGLANSNLILASHFYQYKEIIPVIVTGTSGQDSTTYVVTGRLVDTSGNFIQENKPKFSYSTGFLFHVYPRTGWFANLGLAGGVTIANSNSSPIQLMLGLSTMFHSGKSRVSITGGVVWGQVKTISSVAKDYLWDRDANPDKKIYDNRTSLPLFYQASSDIPTFDQWQHSFFFGLSYNFASVNVGK